MVSENDFLKAGSAVDVFAWTTYSSDCRFEQQVGWIKANLEAFDFLRSRLCSTVAYTNIRSHTKSHFNKKSLEKVLLLFWWIWHGLVIQFLKDMPFGNQFRRHTGICWV